MVLYDLRLDCWRKGLGIQDYSLYEHSCAWSDTPENGVLFGSSTT